MNAAGTDKHLGQHENTPSPRLQLTLDTAGRAEALVDLAGLVARNSRDEYVLAFDADSLILRIGPDDPENQRVSSPFDGGGRNSGQVVLQDGTSRPRVVLNGRTASVTLLAGDGRRAVQISGASGSIIASGSIVTAQDLFAERVFASGSSLAYTFEVDGKDDELTPGTVLVIDGDGRLRPSHSPYDRRVAGIVADPVGDVGMTLRSRPDATTRPVAISGSAYCTVDTTLAPIAPGDLLTTSATRGHAMRADPAVPASGAILGKALARHELGVGRIPVLVLLH